MGVPREPQGVLYRDYRLNLLANQAQEIGVRGDYWQLIKTPGGEVMIEMDDNGRIDRVAPSGGPGDYQRVKITSPVDQAITIALGYTNGIAPYDNRTVITGSLNVVNAPPASINGLPDQVIAAGGTYTFPANANRDTLGISLDDNAPDYVRVASALAPNGVRLYPGGDKNIRTTGAIVVRNPNAVAVTISASETSTP